MVSNLQFTFNTGQNTTMKYSNNSSIKIFLLDRFN